MAWTSIPTTAAGTIIYASTIGSWLTTVKTQANSITSSHCPSHYGSYFSSHKSSVNNSNNGIWTSDGTVGSTHGRKCGGSIWIG